MFSIHNECTTYKLQLVWRSLDQAGTSENGGNSKYGKGGKSFYQNPQICITRSSSFPFHASTQCRKGLSWMLTLCANLDTRNFTDESILRGWYILCSSRWCILSFFKFFFNVFCPKRMSSLRSGRYCSVMNLILSRTASCFLSIYIFCWVQNVILLWLFLFSLTHLKIHMAPVLYFKF